MKKNIIISGGAGFIGSHVVRLFVNKYLNYNIINIDLLTYAGNLNNLNDINKKSNYFFEKGDICNMQFIESIFDKYNITDIIHLAAESHVDRSIEDPFVFAKTNILGTLTLLEIAKRKWKGKNSLFYHISTDEVYGSLGDEGLFSETTNYDPHSPYSASKASSDHFVRAYHDTYGLKTLISNCSNNYGPYQFPEKLIPLFISNIINNQNLPVYGDGKNVRDWLFVEDHASAIDLIFHKGSIGQTYNIGGFNEWKNIDLINILIRTTDQLLGRKPGESKKLITYVRDRLGHDLRYAIDASKIHNELGWSPSLQFEEGIKRTVAWYLENQEWLQNIKSGNYRHQND
tara:strand:+ start:3205 stop:4236 length:1032 start_codon:yes stop_codon:yes gene_type:complete